ncbi:hypothetical protein VUR80DRAFT_1477 [Thermomyces stellatus]
MISPATVCVPAHIHRACASSNAFSAAKSTPSTSRGWPRKHDSRNTTRIHHSTAARIPVSTSAGSRTHARPPPA